MITQEKALYLFNYVDGVLYWKVKYSDKVVVGKSAGCIKDGYLGLKIDKKDYRNHRIIFLMHHGYMPQIVDHIDGNTLNNKIENLREATKFGNNQNSKKPCTNTSGWKGVSWKKDRKKWKVEIWVNRKPKFFGYFDDFESAKLKSIAARNLYHKEFARNE